MTTFKVIIAGSRTFNNYEMLYHIVEHILQDIVSPIEVISGTCRGADKLGERYAKEKGHTIKQFEAQWDKFGRAAGPIRNEEMAKYADAAIVFVCEGSKGAANMVKLAKQYKLKLLEVKV